MQHTWYIFTLALGLQEHFSTGATPPLALLQALCARRRAGAVLMEGGADPAGNRPRITAPALHVRPGARGPARLPTVPHSPPPLRPPSHPLASRTSVQNKSVLYSGPFSESQIHGRPELLKKFSKWKDNSLAPEMS